MLATTNEGNMTTPTQDDVLNAAEAGEPLCHCDAPGHSKCDVCFNCPACARTAPCPYCAPEEDVRDAIAVVTMEMGARCLVRHGPDVTPYGRTHTPSEWRGTVVPGAVLYVSGSERDGMLWALWQAYSAGALDGIGATVHSINAECAAVTL